MKKKEDGLYYAGKKTEDENHKMIKIMLRSWTLKEITYDMAADACVRIETKKQNALQLKSLHENYYLNLED